MLKMIKKEMTMRNMMMSSDAPGSSDAGTQRAKDGGGEGWRRPEQDEYDYHLINFIVVNFIDYSERRQSDMIECQNYSIQALV